MSEHSPGIPDTSIVYAVQYQDATSKAEDWFEMTGRDHNERYRNPSDNGSSHETTSMAEAVDTAEALATRRAYPQDPSKYYYTPVTRARIVVRVHTGHVAAVYEAR
jgi:hypothetical protein